MKRAIGLTLMVTLAIAICGCGGGGGGGKLTPPINKKGTAKITITLAEVLAKTRAIDDVDSVTVTITGSSYSIPTFALTKNTQTGAWEGTKEVLAYNLTFLAEASDSTGKVLYSGQTQKTILADTINDVTITINVPVSPNTWSVTQNGNVLEIAYGSGADFPQYAALHTDSGYFRLINSRTAGWGTSVIIMPSFWTSGRYYQGAGVFTSHEVLPDGRLKILFSGNTLTLSVQGIALLSPPDNNIMQADVSVTTSGSVDLDVRSGEAFKPVMLSSMHISEAQWDCSESFVSLVTNQIPSSSWLMNSPIIDTSFGLKGGSSSWKQNAPTMTITLDTPMPITGWVTPTSNPNNDNIGMWPASDTVLSSWSYTITAKSE